MQDGLESRFDLLTDNERKCLRLAADGLSNDEIATALGRTTGMVAKYVLSGRNKLGGPARRTAGRMLIEHERGQGVQPPHVQTLYLAPGTDPMLIPPDRTQSGAPDAVRENWALFIGPTSPAVDHPEGSHDDLTHRRQLDGTTRALIRLALTIAAIRPMVDFFDWLGRVALSLYR